MLSVQKIFTTYEKLRPSAAERSRELLVMQGTRQQTARKKNIIVYGHRIETVRPVTRIAH